jgi:hypothetical protein
VHHHPLAAKLMWLAKKECAKQLSKKRQLTMELTRHTTKAVAKQCCACCYQRMARNEWHQLKKLATSSPRLTWTLYPPLLMPLADIGRSAGVTSLAQVTSAVP